MQRIVPDTFLIYLCLGQYFRSGSEFISPSNTGIVSTGYGSMYTIGIVTYLKSLPKITSNFNVAFFQKDNQKIVLTHMLRLLHAGPGLFINLKSKFQNIRSRFGKV